MKKTSFILLTCSLFLIFSSCRAKYSLYSTPIHNVTISVNSDSSQTKIVDYSKIEEKDEFEDEFVKFEFVFTQQTIFFNIENKSNQTIKIDWDEIIYIDPYNNSCRVIHQGVKFINKDDRQSPTYIAARSSLKDQLLPVNKIYWLDMEYSGIWMFAGKRGGWNVSPLFENYKSQEEANSSLLINKKPRLVFPIYIDDQKQEYTFEFIIDRIIVGKKKR